MDNDVREEDGVSLKTCDGNEVCFKQQPEEKYTCCSCSNILTAPVRQTQCGHRISEFCSKQLLRQASKVPCPAKDEECVDLTEEEVSVCRNCKFICMHGVPLSTKKSSRLYLKYYSCIIRIRY